MYFEHARVQQVIEILAPGGGRGVSYIGMCRSEVYGFQAVYFRIGYSNQIFLV